MISLARLARACGASWCARCLSCAGLRVPGRPNDGPSWAGEPGVAAPHGRVGTCALRQKALIDDLACSPARVRLAPGCACRAAPCRARMCVWLCCCALLRLLAASNRVSRSLARLRGRSGRAVATTHRPGAGRLILGPRAGTGAGAAVPWLVFVGTTTGCPLFWHGAVAMTAVGVLSARARARSVKIAGKRRFLCATCGTGSFLF